MDLGRANSAWTTTGVCLAIALLLALLRRRSPWGHPPLPPGPPGEFLLGHLRVVPKERTAETYAEWAKKYKSDVIHVKPLGQSIVVLNSVEAAKDLLDRRGANYCDRPRFTLFEVMGWGKTLTFLPFGPRWLMHRKLLQTTFSNSNVRQWHTLQVTEARKSVQSIIKDSENWEKSMKRFAVAIVLKVSYGVDVQDDDDPYVKIAEDAMYATGNGGAPANSIVDIFPPARHLPNWLVRDWSLKFARQWGWAIQKLHDIPFAVAQEEVARGKDNPSFAHALLETYRSNAKNGVNNDWSLDDIKGAAGAIFIAGADTVTSPSDDDTFMSKTDADFSSRTDLGNHCCSLENDVYNGMFIPKGSIVFFNSRAMTQDERIYQDPKSFNPDRYQPQSSGGHGEPLPLGQFGFGRRICIGRFLADNSVWIAVATMLATLKFGKKVGPDGQVVEPKVVFTNGGTCHPEHFECSITPRNDRAKQLLSQSPSLS
ncbi:O-methylsterigmatocystin oxidoreductase 1 [Colletotrichum chlorophyti]|uniref:O-methylsterigmatocystin oxidoreductase 1 n=1 Tax=Colletotrichum chlorophyti TaxID=708187 RepID=A0A1Q8RV08_9PEZI|nr:O-methylsterigmatocystin oxidoreductase 1 [Colletotrichum chlorophyti]